MAYDARVGPVVLPVLGEDAQRLEGSVRLWSLWSVADYLKHQGSKHAQGHFEFAVRDLKRVFLHPWRLVFDLAGQTLNTKARGAHIDTFRIFVCEKIRCEGTLGWKSFKIGGMSEHAPIPVETNVVAKRVYESAFRVHTNLGPGLLESVYAGCLAHEMAKVGLAFRREVGLPVVYEEVRFEVGYRLDFLVEECVILEIKAVEALHPVHIAQLLTYLKLSERRVGLLINFNVPVLKEGVRRLVR